LAVKSDAVTESWKSQTYTYSGTDSEHDCYTYSYSNNLN